MSISQLIAELGGRGHLRHLAKEIQIDLCVSAEREKHNARVKDFASKVDLQLLSEVRKVAELVKRAGYEMQVTGDAVVVLAVKGGVSSVVARVMVR